jgi:hypothetical protein
MPGSGLFTRTPGFYKTHPDITEAIISGVGGITVCGHRITNVNVNSAQSALEALCIAVHGDQRAQLLRQLLTAALTMAADGATYPDFSACDAVCRDPGASTGGLAGCIDGTDAFNNSGDNIFAPWDPPGPAQSGACEAAFETACAVLTPTTCTLP